MLSRYIHITVLLFVVFLLSLDTFGQSIRGNVKTSNGEALQYCSIYLQNPKNHEYINVCVTDEKGNFKFSNKKIVFPYRLVVKCMAMKTKVLVDSQMVVPTIMMEHNEHGLNNVEVKAKKPEFKLYNNGGFSYDARDIMQNRPSTSLLDILDEVPLIQKDNEVYNVIGTNKSTITINGRSIAIGESQLIDYLRNIPAYKVRNIEVFFTAPANSITSGALINVVLEDKRYDKLVTKGEAHTYIRSNLKYLYPTGGTSIEFANKKWNFYANYGIGKPKNDYEMSITSNHTYNDYIYHIFFKDDMQKKNMSHSGSAAFTIDLKNDVKLSANYSGRINYDNSYSTTFMNAENTIVNASNSIDGHNLWHSVNLDLSKNELKIGFKYFNYDLNTKQYLSNQYNGFNVDYSYRSKQNLNTYKAFASYTKDLGFAQISGGIDMFATRTFSSQATILNGKAKNTDVNENVIKEREFDCFVGWTQKFGKKASINANFHISLMKSTEKNVLENRQLWHSFNFMPNINFMYNLKNQNSVQVNFSSEKKYPKYTNVSTRKIFSNSYCINESNPMLEPSHSFKLAVNYILKRKYIIGFYSTYSPKIIVQQLYQNKDALTASYKIANSKWDQKVGLIGVLPIKWNKNFSTRISANIFYDILKFDLEDIHTKVYSFGGDITIRNTITLDRLKTWSLTADCRYNLPTKKGIYDSSANGFVDAGLSWSPNKTNWRFSIKASNIFDTYVQKLRINYNEQNLTSQRNYSERLFLISIVYRFGGYKEKHYNEVDTSRLGM